MQLQQALEMVESLLSDNEQSISSLGCYGDEVSILLYEELERRSNEHPTIAST